MTESPRLTVLFASGGTTAAGIPSTAAITQHLMEPDESGYRAQFFKQVEEMLIEEGGFKSVNFELLLHALEEIIPLKFGDGGFRRADYFRPVVKAFATLTEPASGLFENVPISDFRQFAVNKIFRLIHKSVLESPTKEAALSEFFIPLSEQFLLKAFTLNYDDLLDRVNLPWRDGFVENLGKYHMQFSPKDFLEASDGPGPLLVHTHGSIRFGFAQGALGIHKYYDPKVAENHLEDKIGSTQNVHGKIIFVGPIISGLNKVSQLFFQSAPYAFYLKGLMDNMLRNPRLLIVGYGGWDRHVNDWILEFLKFHDDDARLVYASKGAAAKSSNGPNKALISRILIDTGEHRFAKQNEPYYGKRVALEPAPFPFEDKDTTERIIKFLQG